MRRIRLTALLLAVLMLCGSFAACSKSDDGTDTPSNTEGSKQNTGSAIVDPGKTDTPTQSVTDAVTGSDEPTASVSGTEEPTETVPPAAVADPNFYGTNKYAGKQVNVLYWNDTLNAEFDIEGEGGVPINDAIYARDRSVEEKLGVEIVWLGQAHAGNVFKSYVTSNINDGLQIVAGHSMDMGALTSEGNFTDLNQSDNIDFTKAWWPNDLIKDATINGKIYFCSGDISNNALLGMEAMFFNKTLTENDYYAMVEDGTWTLDKFVSECENKYDDKNGDGNKDENDLYGFATYNGMINALFIGMGIRLVEQGDDGKLKLSDTYVTEKTQTLIERYNTYLHVGKDMYYASKFEASAQMFKEGKSLFYMASVRLTINTISDAKDLKYGVLPAPKYDTQQKEYHTLSANTYSLYAIAKTVDTETFDACSALIEALACESYRIVTPVVFETTLKLRYSDDDNDSRMFDILRASTVTEIGLIFSNQIAEGVPSKALFSMIDANQNTWMSYMQGKSKTLSRSFDKLNKAFED